MSQGMTVCGPLSDETELHVWLRDYFRDNGWTAARDVRSDDSRVRIDLVVDHPTYGRVGVVAPYFGDDAGSDAAAVHHRITRRYRDESVDGERIELWALCPYWTGINGDSKFFRLQQRHRSNFTREFFAQHGIGYIDLQRPTVVVNVGHDEPGYEIPVGGRDAERYGDEVDIEAIRRVVAERVDRFDYR